jgi:hypothetical protein
VIVTMSHAPFAPCPSCARHVRVDAAACPFCATHLADTTFDPVPDQGGRRLGRAALFAFATTVAAAGCPSPQRPDTGTNNNIVQPYGAPPTPPRPNDAGTVAAPPDPGLVVAIYGAPMPPPDAATPDATAPTPDATAPDAPAPDASRPDARPPRPPRPGPPMVRYGAPPPPDASDAA